MVGRSSYCTIVLSNHLASRQHCALRLDGTHLEVMDLASSNGTFVNGERIEAARPLQDGDVVRIGTDVLEVEAVMRLPGSPRARRTTGPHALQTESQWEVDESSTETHTVTLQLLEALVSGAGSTRHPWATAVTVQRALESWLAVAPELTRTERARLSAVIETVASWNQAVEVEEWRERILQVLAEKTES